MEQHLKIYTDGGARGNPGPAAAAFVAVKNGKVIYKGAIFLGRATNNEAEYNGVIIALQWFLRNLKTLNEKKIIIFLDSQLVVRQLGGFYKVKSKNLKPLVFKIKGLEKKISSNVNYVAIPRAKNRLADTLVNIKIDENTKEFHVSQGF